MSSTGTTQVRRPQQFHQPAARPTTGAKQTHSPPRKYLSPAFRNGVPNNSTADTAAGARLSPERRSGASLVIPNGQSSTNLQYMARLQRPSNQLHPVRRTNTSTTAVASTTAAATSSARKQQQPPQQQPPQQRLARSSTAPRGKVTASARSGSAVSAGSSSLGLGTQVGVTRGATAAAARATPRVQTPPSTVAALRATSATATQRRNAAAPTTARQQQQQKPSNSASTSSPTKQRIVHTVGATKGDRTTAGLRPLALRSFSTTTTSPQRQQQQQNFRFGKPSATASASEPYSASQNNKPATRSPPSIPVRQNRTAAARCELTHPTTATASPTRGSASVNRSDSPQKTGSPVRRQQQQQQQQQQAAKKNVSPSRAKQQGTATATATPSWKSYVSATTTRTGATGSNSNDNVHAELPEHLVYREPRAATKQFAHVQPRYLSPPKHVDADVYRAQHGLNPSPTKRPAFNTMPNVPSRYRSPPKTQLQRQHEREQVAASAAVPREVSFVASPEYAAHKRTAASHGIAAPSRFLDPALYHASDHGPTPRQLTEERQRQHDEECKKGSTHFHVHDARAFATFEEMANKNDDLHHVGGTRSNRATSVVMEYVRHGIEIPSDRPKDPPRHVEPAPAMDGQIYYGGGGAGGGSFARRTNSPVKKALSLQEQRANAMVERLHSAPRTKSPPRVAALQHTYSTMTRASSSYSASSAFSGRCAPGQDKGARVVSPTRHSAATSSSNRRGTSPQKREVVFRNHRQHEGEHQQQQQQQQKGQRAKWSTAGAKAPPSDACKGRDIKVTYYVKQLPNDDNNVEGLDEDDGYGDVEQHHHQQHQQDCDGGGGNGDAFHRSEDDKGAKNNKSPSPSNPGGSEAGVEGELANPSDETATGKRQLPCVFDIQPVPTVHWNAASEGFNGHDNDKEGVR